MYYVIGTDSAYNCEKSELSRSNMMRKIGTYSPNIANLSSPCIHKNDALQVCLFTLNSQAIREKCERGIRRFC